MYETVYCTKSRQWKWPFVCLRKYGWSDGIFSFEAGTRCLTGEGLYAFATPRAQEIFNKVAERCAPPVQKLNYEDIKLSLEYESNANYVSHTPIKKTTCKHIRSPKGRVSESKPNAKMGTGFNSTSTPTDLHRYVNTYLHPTYDNTPMSPLPSIVSSPGIHVHSNSHMQIWRTCHLQKQIQQQQHCHGQHSTPMLTSITLVP